MTKTTLQLRRGTQSENALFTGAEGEVSVDTTRKTLIVHDGVTVGGTALAKLSSPAFTGTPTAPTPTGGDNTTKIATTAYVQTAIAGFSAPPATTDDLTEGTTNLYFSQDNLFGALTAGGSVSITQPGGSGNNVVISYTQPTNVSAFSNDAGYLTSASILNSLSVVSTPSGALTYDSVSGQFTFTQAVASVNGYTNVIVLNTDDISDSGRTNKWASASVVRGHLSAGTGITFSAGAFGLTNTSVTVNSKSLSLLTGGTVTLNTDDISEGSTNKWASATNVRSYFSNGTGVTITNGQVSIGQSVATSASPTFVTGNFTDIAVNTNLIQTDSSNARVGVNKTAPAYTLDVGGDINFTGKLRVSGSAGTANYVLLSGGNGSSPTWANIAASLPDIYEVDRFGILKDGATVKFKLYSNSVEINPTYPAQLLVIKNNQTLVPWLNNSGHLWQPLVPFGDYTIDSAGDIVFSTPLQLTDNITIRWLVGNVTSPVYTTYPFRAIDIMIGT